MLVSVPQQAEFSFKESIHAQRQKIWRLQNFLLAVVALLILCLTNSVIICILLELLLFLLAIHTRRSLVKGVCIENLMVRNKRVTVTIDGSHYALSSYHLDYMSRWLATVRLTTTAGTSYCLVVFPSLMGTGKYCQLMALLKAARPDVPSQIR